MPHYFMTLKYLFEQALGKKISRYQYKFIYGRLISYLKKLNIYPVYCSVYTLISTNFDLYYDKKEKCLCVGYKNSAFFLFYISLRKCQESF